MMTKYLIKVLKLDDNCILKKMYNMLKGDENKYLSYSVKIGRI